MVQPVTEWDTASNKAALSDKPNAALYGEAGIVPSDRTDDGFTPTDERLLDLMKNACTQGLDYLQRTLSGKWQNSHRAYNNQHFDQSKYLSARWRGRSRLFRPKTRSAVRRKAAEAAQALFTTPDLVAVTPQDPDNLEHQAAAAINQALLQYRLDRSSENTGVPWFSIAMGAHQSAQITALSVSKQYWEFREETVAVEESVYLNPDGTEEVEKVPVTRVVRDRPRVRLFPPENVIRDPSASWEDQAQESSYLILQYPVPFHELRELVKIPSQKSKVRYRQFDEEKLKGIAGFGSQAAGNDTAQAVRRSRETATQDRYEDQSVDVEFRIVWLHENFMKIDGTDWHWWSIGRQHILTDPVPVIDAYPEQGGARPVVIGLGSLEPFKIDPMAAVEAWQPLQQEMNDIVNLRLDTAKQTVSPIAIVARGKQIDLAQVQNRSPDSVIYANDIERDIKFERPGDVAASAYAEMEKLNADFDDQAGTFGIGTVQTNRHLGETVGGMKLVSGTANAMGEFDLRVWIETWVEPVLRQVIKLEQFYETDEMVLGIAGKKAQLHKKFGQDAITDELLTKQVLVRVNAGLGAFDPMQRIAKLRMTFETLGLVLGPTAQQRLKQDEVIKAIMGAGGEGDGERFFHEGDNQDPRIMEMRQITQQAIAQVEDKSADRANKIQLERMKIAGELLTNMLRSHSDMQRDQQGAQFKAEQAHQRSIQMQLLNSLLDPSRLPDGQGPDGAGATMPVPSPIEGGPLPMLNGGGPPMMNGGGPPMLPSQGAQPPMAPPDGNMDLLGLGSLLKEMQFMNEQSNQQMMMMFAQAMQQMGQQIAQAMTMPRELVRTADGRKLAMPTLQ